MQPKTSKMVQMKLTKCDTSQLQWLVFLASINCSNRVIGLLKPGNLPVFIFRTDVTMSTETSSHDQLEQRVKRKFRKDRGNNAIEC